MIRMRDVASIGDTGALGAVDSGRTDRALASAFASRHAARRVGEPGIVATLRASSGAVFFGLVNMPHAIAAIGSLVALAMLGITSHARSESTTLVPDRDATLYETLASPAANGAGQFLFAGQTFQGLHGYARRAIVRFDLSSIPADAAIVDVRLLLNLVQLQGNPSEISVHRATSDWTAGASDPSGNEGQGADPVADDCTWLYASFDGVNGGTAWAHPGGDFARQASASALTIDPGFYEWSSPQLADDVRLFLADPSANHGWFVLGNETQPGTARRFDSGDAKPGIGTKPTLIVEWTPAARCAGDLDRDGGVDAADLGVLLGAWQTPAADLDGDGTTDASDLATLLGAWGPCP